MNSDDQRSLDRIQTLVNMGRLEDARTEAQQAVARAPQEGRAWTALAVVENQRADYPAAIAAAERALAIDPTNARAMYVLGPALFNTGKHRDAKRMMDQLVNSAPQWAPGLIQRALVYSWHIATYITWGQRGGIPPEAELKIVRENGEAGLELDPHNAQNYGLVAESRYLIHDVGVGAQLIDSGLRLDPTSEFLLFQKARFGLLNTTGTVEAAQSILNMNPRNVHALRMLHDIAWRRLYGLVAWPSTVGALSATFAYASFLYSSDGFARSFLAALLVPAVIAWAIMFSSFRTASKALEFSKIFRDNPLGRVGFVVTIVANGVLVVGLVWLFVMPLKDPEPLAQALSLLSVTVAAFAAGEILMRIAVSRAERRTGLYADTPEGRFSARYVARRQFDGNFNRLLVAFIVLLCSVLFAWVPGIAALAAMAAALVATVLVKKGTASIMRGGRTAPVVWFVFAALFFASALYCVVAQLGVAASFS